jgi:hypothetical protein
VYDFDKIEKTITWLHISFHRNSVPVKEAAGKEGGNVDISLFSGSLAVIKAFAGMASLGHSPPIRNLKPCA